MVDKTTTNIESIFVESILAEEVARILTERNIKYYIDAEKVAATLLPAVHSIEGICMLCLKNKVLLLSICMSSLSIRKYCLECHRRVNQEYINPTT